MIRLGPYPLIASVLLLSALAYAANSGDAHARAAAWLTAELHQPVTAAQVRSGPELDTYAGCRIARATPALTGGTSLELRCPASALRQVMLVDLVLPPITNGVSKVPRTPGGPMRTMQRKQNIVNAGARLQAEWRTPSMRAVLPVVALEAGSGGDEIRVRLSGGKRIYRARVVSGQAVEILQEGT